MSGGRPRGVYAVPVDLKGVGWLKPFPHYKKKFKGIPGLSALENRSTPNEEQFSDHNWGLLCDLVVKYIRELQSLEKGIPKDSFRGKRDRQGKAVRLAKCLGEVYEIWKSMSPDEIDAFIDAGFYDRGNNRSEARFRNLMDKLVDQGDLGTFAAMVPDGLRYWDSQKAPTPLAVFIARLVRRLNIMELQPFRKIADEVETGGDEYFLVAYFAFNLVDAYRTEFPQFHELLSKTGMKSVKTMHNTVNELKGSINIP